MNNYPDNMDFDKVQPVYCDVCLREDCLCDEEEEYLDDDEEE